MGSPLSVHEPPPVSSGPSSPDKRDIKGRGIDLSMPERKHPRARGKRSTVHPKGHTVACSDGCGATAELTFSGRAPHEVALLSKEGWAVLNSPEEHSIVFLCPTCFKQAEGVEDLDEEDSDEIDDIEENS